MRYIMLDHGYYTREALRLDVTERLRWRITMNAATKIEQEMQRLMSLSDKSEYVRGLIQGLKIAMTILDESDIL